MSWNPFAKKNAAEQQPAAATSDPARNAQLEDDFEDIEVTKRRWEQRRRQAMEERSKREGAGAVEPAKVEKKQSAASRHFQPCAIQMGFGSAMGVAVGLSTGVIAGILMGPSGQKVPLAIAMAKRQAAFFGGIFGIGGGLQYAKVHM
jgi:hypothetical protein